MDAEAALDRFDRLAVWSRGDQRTPHKPLLVLSALGRWCRGDQAAPSNPPRGGSYAYEHRNEVGHLLQWCTPEPILPTRVTP